MRWLLKSPLIVAAIAACALQFGMGYVRAHAAAPPIGAKYLCLIVLDAGRPDYITQNIQSMPTMQSLLRGGRWYDSAWVGDLLSVTPPSHAVISTGSLPRNDGGIVNWDWANRSTGSVSPSLQSLENFQNNYAFRIIRQSGTPSLAQVIRRRYPRGLVIAGSGAHFHAAGMLGGPYANWIFAYQRMGSAWAPFTLGPHPVPPTLLHDPSLRVTLPASNGSTVPLIYQPLKTGQQGEYTMRFAAKAVASYRPRALMVNLAGPDTTGHWSTRWRAEEAIVYRDIDRSLSDLIAAYKRAGIYNQTLFVITSDHGIMRSKHRVFARDALNSLLSRLNVDTYPVSDTGGTMMPLWLRDPGLNRDTAHAIYAQHFDNVSAVFYLQHRGSRYVYRMAGCEGCSNHLIAAYRYLFGTEAGPTAEDVAILFRENARLSGLPWMPGRHSGADWASQHMTLLLSGPGVRPGTSHHPARLADIAPTVERFMGITPHARDGLVLADAFAKPLPPDAAAQSRADRELGIYVTALQQRASSDTQLEARGRMPNVVPEDEFATDTDVMTVPEKVLWVVQSGHIRWALKEANVGAAMPTMLKELTLLVLGIGVVGIRRTRRRMTGMQG